MKNILVISPSEICYHPRLVKAVDFYLQKGCTVTIVNTITGSAPVKIYREFYSNRLVGCIELNIDKRSKKSKIRWAFNSMLQLLLIKNWKYLHIPILFPYILNKGLIGISNIKGDYDVIHINLVDTLPLASKIKRKQKNKAALIYDSQEYFTGQYAKYAKEKYNWVAKAEKQYLKDTDIILGTTNVMVEKIQGKYHVVQPIIRVRNIPSGNEIRTITENKST